VFLLLCLVLVVNIFLNLEKRCCKLNKLKWKKSKKDTKIRSRKEKQISSIIIILIIQTQDGLAREKKVCKNRSMDENSQNGHFATFSMPNRRKNDEKI